MINQYLLALGDWDLETMNSESQDGLFYMFFIMATFFSQVILLNMLIAIMGDSYEKVMENK